MTAPVADLPGIQTERGCLAIADISGYTSYLVDSELTHAQDVLADLLEAVVHALQGAFRLAKLEGDAAFVYLPGDHPDAALVFDRVTATYRSFRNRLASVTRATTCNCNACVLIPSLDLKLVLHHGEYVRRVVAGSEELTGADVIVVHRLLKNHVTEAFGAEPYAYYTDACLAALGVDPAGRGLRPHRESFEGVGEVTGWVDNLVMRAAREDDPSRVRVTPNTPGALEIDLSLPADPATVWEWLTVPERRARWTRGLDRIDQNSAAGVRGVGTTNHCVHGSQTTLEEIVDWQPFETYTVRSRQPQPIVPVVLMTFELEPAAGGSTHARVRFAPEGGRRNALVWRGVRGQFLTALRRAGDDLRRAVAEDNTPPYAAGEPSAAPSA